MFASIIFFNLLVVLVGNLMSYLRAKSETESVTTDTAFRFNSKDTLLFSTRYAHNLCFKQTGEIDNLIASWERSTRLCCVQVPRCFWPKTSQQESLNGALVGVLLSQSASPSVICLSSPRTIKPWFLN
jgi:hypothetical protein